MAGDSECQAAVSSPGDSLLGVHTAAFVTGRGSAGCDTGGPRTDQVYNDVISSLTKLFLSLTFHMIHADGGDMHTMPRRGRVRPKTTPSSSLQLDCG